jgi:cytoskeletal protein CcmA (bactofilin family)
MFSKTANRPQAKTTPMAPIAPSEPMRSKSLKAASLISSDLSVNGGLVSEGEVHVDGKVQGDVKVMRLTLGENGVIEGSITAESVEIRGKVVGPVTAKLVRLFASSHVDGDITHEQLAMETGAHFQGRSLKLQRAGAAPVAHPAGVVTLNPAPAAVSS